MLDKSPKDSEMTDAAIAKGIITGLWPIEILSRSVVIARAFAGIKKVERALPSDILRKRSRQWTERRVRSIVDDEVRRVDHYEIADLEILAMREARNEFRKSMQRAARMAAFLQATDPDFHGPEIDRLREWFGAVDRA